jgi:prepilin-type N-terminal cleavage/methylation domain-containing protein
MRGASQRGFTLVELLVVMAILIIVFAGSTYYFDGVFRKVSLSQSLIKNASTVKTTLEEARSYTVSAKSGSVYGVHFDSNQIVLYKGSIYSVGAAGNSVRVLDNSVTISSINLNGGGSDVLFQKISGETDKYGSVTLRLVTDTSKTKVITIGKAGLISSQ